jgi:3-keto-L-gulonate-6-phosphate decarboxylase
MTTLHYALDVTGEVEALALARLAAERGVGVIEAGSLLVKTAGLAIIPKLRAVAPRAVLVADLKTLDMGAEEVAAAAGFGADEVIIAAAASNATISAAVGAARASNMRGLATLIGVADWAARAHELKALGVSVILGHNAAYLA